MKGLETVQFDSIAQFLNIKRFPFQIMDSNNNVIYTEDKDGFWIKYEFDEQGNNTYMLDACGRWEKSQFDANGRRISFEDWEGKYKRWKYDSKGNLIYLEEDGTWWNGKP